MGWLQVLGFLGFTQQGNRPFIDGSEDFVQGPAIDIRFNLARPWQRLAYDALGFIGFRYFLLADNQDAYPFMDGITKTGDIGPVTYYTRVAPPREERPPPVPPAPPPAAPPRAGGFPGIGLDYLSGRGRRIRESVGDYMRELYPEARPAFAYSLAA